MQRKRSSKKSHTVNCERFAFFCCQNIFSYFDFFLFFFFSFLSFSFNMSALDLQFDETRFVNTLTGLIGEAERLQNNPPRHVPQEDLAIAHVRRVLDPLSDAHGGPLKIRHVAYIPGRGNLIVEYPGTTDKMVSFVGSHLDVVPADPSKWSVDPFKLTRDGDKLYGRGATDCLGHVALITDLLAALATKKPALKVGVTVVFIASEENSSVPGVGVDVLEKNGLLKPRARTVPVYWVDCADSKPCKLCVNRAPRVRSCWLTIVCV
jgi:acetylornithine deacetylase